MSTERTSWRNSGLADRLRSVRGETPPDRRNGLAMVLSVVIAVFLSFVFRMNAEYTIDVEVPLEYTLPRDKALSERPPNEARVTVSGDGWSLLSILGDPQPIRSRVSDRTVNVLTAIQESGQLSDVTIQRSTPEIIELTMEDRESRLLPIRLVRQLTMEPSYDLLRPPHLAPDSVLVSGAPSVIGNLLDWPTEPLVESGIRDSIRRVVALSDTLKGLIVGKLPQATLVSVPVAAFTQGERMLEVEVRNLPAGVAAVRTEPSRVRVRYAVPAVQAADEQARTNPDFVAVVDYADIVRDSLSRSVPVAVQIPPGLDVRNVELEVRRVEYVLVLGAPPSAAD